MFEPSFGQNAAAIVGLPFAAWLSALGTGLAIERVTGARLPNALLLPLGLAGGIVLSYSLYAAGTTDVLPVALLCVIAVAGLKFARGGVRSRLNPGLPGLAGLCVFVLFMLPVLVSGHWLWMGYNFDDDTSVQFLLAAHLKTSGMHQVVPQLTTAAANIDSYLQTAYPLGAHAELATLSGLLHTGPEVVYQSYLSALAAIVAVAVAAAATPAIGARRAAVLGFAAASSNLFYQYAMQGNIKEIATAAMVVASFALIAEALRARRAYSGVVIAAVPLAATLCTYGAAGSPYVLATIGGGAVMVVLNDRRLPRRSWIAPAALGAAVVGLLSIPALVNFSTLFNVASAVGGPNSGTGGGAAAPAVSMLGQLTRQLPLSQISGVWLSGDYRDAITAHPAAGLTTLASAVILLLLIPGLLVSLRRRDAGVLVAAIATGLVLLILIPRVSPYFGGKVYAMASPVVVWIAGVGLCSLNWRRLRPLMMLAGAAIVAAIVVSDLLAYHTDQPSPTSRMLEIEATAKHVAGHGAVLFNESDQFIKYFAGNTDTIAPFESITPDQVQLINPSANIFDYFFDLDQETLAYVESFPVIVTRRSPIVSRPPANYRLFYSNSLYLGWEREARPVVLAHLPLQSEWQGSLTPPCTAVASLVANAPRGSELIQAVTPPDTGFSVLYAPTRPFSWGINQDPYFSVTPHGPGKVFETVRVPVGGLYRAWVQGSFPRPMRVLVDGRTVGQVDGIDSPDQWSQAGVVHLSAGKHVLEIYRGGGRIYPGDGAFEAEVGYVMLAKAGPEVLHTVPVSRWRSLCSSPADWIELVKP
jgi:hypothetical protein